MNKFAETEMLKIRYCDFCGSEKVGFNNRYYYCKKCGSILEDKSSKFKGY